VTLEQWLPRWIDEREQAGELRDTTAATYRQLIEHKPDGLLAGQPTILTKLGHMRLVDLRGTHLTQTYQALMADRAAARAKAEQANQRRKVRFGVPPPLGPVTIARLHAVVSGALKTAMKEDIMPTNPAANAKLPKRERTKCIPWPPEVLGAFLDAVADHRLYPVFVLAAFTGLRRGEIAGLQWADIDLDGAKLTVARQRVVLTGQNEAVIHHDTKTAAGQRVVWLDSATADTLRAWRRRQNEERLALGPDYSEPGVWLFTDEAGRPHRPEHYTKSFQREVRRLGFPPAHLHSLRHVRAASLISVGEEITTVSKLLGHASVKVTADIYGSLYEAKGREAGEKAAALVPRKRQSSSG
jgi:integrase